MPEQEHGAGASLGMGGGERTREGDREDSIMTSCTIISLNSGTNNQGEHHFHRQLNRMFEC